MDAWMCKMLKNGRQLGRRREEEMGNGSVEEKKGEDESGKERVIKNICVAA